ncbi:MAG: DUF58 domain-containing protein [Rhodospirillaceae bacterium]|nr:DUF58 domain-containing protein [Rhodospirillaceae bacterium]
MKGPWPGLTQRAEALAAGLPALLAEAERVAAAVREGAHGRRRSGAGDDFWQFRPYRPGDPAAAVDWRQSGKSDRLYVRENEWTAAETVWLWVDDSASMRWRSVTRLPEKKQRAHVIALALAFLLIEAGERVGVLGQDETPVSDRAGIARLAAMLTAPADGEAPPREVPRERGHLVLFSDFLSPEDDVDPWLQGLSGRGAKGHLVQILDPAEIDFPYQGRVLFSGLEGEPAYRSERAEDLAHAYTARLAALQDRLAGQARHLGWSVDAARTDEAAQAALIRLHAAVGGI